MPFSKAAEVEIAIKSVNLNRKVLRFSFFEWERETPFIVRGDERMLTASGVTGATL